MASQSSGRSSCDAGRRAFVLAGLATAIGGCAGAPPVPVPRPLEPVTLAVTVVAQPEVNPDSRGRPSPISVRVFELRSAAGFEAADFFSLYERDQATLAGELLGREQFILKPGESQVYTRKANADSRFIGVLAGYRDLERSRWRAIAPVAAPAEAGRAGGGAGRQQRMRIVLDRTAVRIEVSPGS